MKRIFILGDQRSAPDIVTDETYKLMAAHFLNIGNEARPTAHSYVTACGSQDIIVNWSQVAQLVCYDESPEDDNVQYRVWAAHDALRTASGEQKEVGETPQTEDVTEETREESVSRVVKMIRKACTQGF